jgi:putative transposase
MTLPRRVLPNRTYLITRRCSERRFFLRPDPQVTWIFEYLLALACERHGIELHGFVCMSNHYHLVVTDRDAHLPEFQQYFNSLLARAVNCARGRWEAFWSRDSFSAVELLEHADVVDKLAYTLLNPVRAGLVGRARAWGGATSASMRFGGRRLVARPSDFFSDNMPEHASLELVAPAFQGEFGSKLDEQLAARLQAVEQQLRKSGCRPMGMAVVLRQPWNESPAAREPRRGLVPRLAARCATVRIAAIFELQHWVKAYRTALACFKAGQREVEWPPGTYRMCSRLGCPDASPQACY